MAVLVYSEDAMLRRSFVLGALSASCRGAANGLGTIAYRQPDGLWLRDLPNGKARLLATGNIDSPRFSPTGRWIAFFRDEAAFVAPAAGGAPRQLGTVAHGPANSGCQWIPGADELLVAGAAGLRIFSPATGWPGTIPNGGLPAAFSPDGRDMVYWDAVTRGRGPGGEPIRTGRLCRVAMRQPDQPRVLYSKYLEAQFPVVWTGDSIVFRADPDFSASLAADGLELWRLPASGGTPQPLGVTTMVNADTVSVSPAGKLAVSAGAGREDWHGRRIAVIDPATAAVTYLTGPQQAAVSPAWSPAGDRIAFAAAPSAPVSAANGDATGVKRVLARRRLWVADPAGGTPPSVLTRDPLYRDEEPVWSADGKFILFCRIDLRDRKSLWLMEADGSALFHVTDLAASPRPADDWFGYYGHIDWGRSFDWFQA